MTNRTWLTRKALLILACLVLELVSCTSAQPPATAEIPTVAPTAPAEVVAHADLALVHGTLLDGTGGPALEDATLLIGDGRIVAVGPSSAVPVPEQCETIDVRGMTILPGWINAHIHGGYDLGRLSAWAREGVTTVRDLHTGTSPIPYDLRQQAAQDSANARLVVAGRMITAPGGYPTAIFGGDSLEVATPDEAREAANDLLDQGVEVIKIAVESGSLFGKPIPMLSLEQIQTIVEAAHQRQSLVVAHVTVSDDLRLALDGGVDDIAHMVVDNLPEELISRMVGDGVYWEPTLELWHGVDQWQGQVAKRNLGQFVAAGGLVALGTDYAGYYTPFQLGMPMREMEWMQEAGMSAAEIIVAATKNAGHVSNVEGLGTLEVGRIADVLVVQGDPLKDLHALLDVQYVIHNGDVIRVPGS